MIGFEPTISWSQTTRPVQIEKGPNYPTPECVQSERSDLNRGHRPATDGRVGRPGPQPGAMPDFATFCLIPQLSPSAFILPHRSAALVDTPYGNRTRACGLKDRNPEPLDERGMLCAYVPRRVGREALESSSAVLQTAAKPSQLPAHVLVGI